METERTIYMPYQPRPQQKEAQAFLDAHRFSVIIAHRRFGKTVLCVNQLIRSALRDGKADGAYAYLAPFRNQAKNIAWSYLKRYTSLIPDRKVNEAELAVTLPHGQIIRLFGADNPDALRGLYFDGIVIDEVAQIRRELWAEVVRPALADRHGWALFIGTPRGLDLLHDLYVQANRDVTGEWGSLMYRISDTDALPQAEVEKMRAETDPAVWKREMECDFTTSTDNVLVTLEDATAATQRHYMPNEYIGTPLILGVDIARFGADATVLAARRGLHAYRPLVLRGKDNVQVAERVVAYCHEQMPYAIYIDAGQGQGVIDILVRLLPMVYEIPFGGKALDSARFVNRRSEMYYLLREWLRAGGQLPDDKDLLTELTAPTYSFNLKGQIALESKDAIKERLGRSVDRSDALALTFAFGTSSHALLSQPTQQFGITSTDPLALQDQGQLGSTYGSGLPTPYTPNARLQTYATGQTSFDFWEVV